MKIHTEVSIDPASGEETETHFLEHEDGTREPLVVGIDMAKESTHLSWWIIARLHAAGVTSPAAARAMTDEDLDAIDGIGPVALREIREVLG